MTPLAHAVRFAMRCGITKPDDLARELECTPSAVYRALKQLNESDRTVKDTDQPVTSDRTELTERSESDPVVTKTDPTVTDEPRVYARIETPSGLVIPKLEVIPPEPPQPKRRARSQGGRLPSDWELPADYRLWAKTNCFATDDEIDREAANFADYWIAKPNNATSLDWKRTWQKWARKAFSSAGRHRNGSYSKTTDAQRILAGIVGSYA
jgi:hypothetical protein